MDNLRETLKADYQAFCLQSERASSVQLLILILKSVKFRYVLYLRLANFFYLKNKVLSNFFYNKNLRRSVDIHPQSQIGKGLRLAHPLAIVIGKDAIIGEFVRIQQGVTIGGNSGRVSKINKSITMPVIGDMVLLGPGSSVLGPISVGRLSILGANSVLTKDVNEERSIIAGIPADRVGSINTEMLTKYHYKALLGCKYSV